MGDLRRVLAEVTLEDYPSKKLSIELNHGSGDSPDIIHLQTDSWRIELERAEYMEFYAAVVAAKKKFEGYKE